MILASLSSLKVHPFPFLIDGTGFYGASTVCYIFAKTLNPGYSSFLFIILLRWSIEKCRTFWTINYVQKCMKRWRRKGMKKGPQVMILSQSRPTIRYLELQIRSIFLSFTWIHIRQKVWADDSNGDDIAISVLVSVRTARIISCKMLFINFTLSHNLNGCFDSPNNLVFFLNFFLRYNYYDYYYWCITIIIMITPNK